MVTPALPGSCERPSLVLQRISCYCVSVETCEVCGLAVAEWPAGWSFYGVWQDGEDQVRAFCAAHRPEIPPASTGGGPRRRQPLGGTAG